MKKIDIQALKEKHGEVYELPVDDKVAYLRKPKMMDYKNAFSAMQKDGELAFGERMLDLLFIAGDEEIKTNDDYFFPARKELLELIENGEAEIFEDGQISTIIIGDAKCKVRQITRNDLKMAEKKNPGSKPFVTQEKLFEMIVLEKDEAFNDRENAAIRFPLFKAMESLQNKKVASIKKL